ncbi:MAG TPA: MBL fold metallo-hydrolase [Candidatus Saccharimonadales bacterium]|nr:MBL fold metallo-hydrolase [Candidatus Saccharimonadales bacterium]
MKVKFLGAAGTVTGSCYLLTSYSGDSILIDCGMFQGAEELENLNYAKLACDCSKVSGLILTHAHLDHCGRLPMLIAQGFTKNIWMTAPTRDLTEISLVDSAKINNEDLTKKPLYSNEDVDQIIRLFKTVEYDTSFTVGSFNITMRDAGHILGSASLEIIDQSAQQGIKKIIFSGDLGNTPQDLIRATELIDNGDVVVMESTYGDKSHPTDNPSDIIQSEINSIEQYGATLLIPAFSIERSQEILHRILHLKKSGKVKESTTVYFDSPMGEKATQVFEKYRQYYNTELTADLASSDPFSFTGLVNIENPHESSAIDQSEAPKVIIAGSGMMTGGRIVKHAMHYLPIESTRLLIVGYQAERTLGRALLEGQKLVNIFGVDIEVKAHVSDTQTMSSHADQPRLLHWLKNIKNVKKLILTHGEDIQRSALSEKVKTDLMLTDIALPTLNQELEF